MSFRFGAFEFREERLQLLMEGYPLELQAQPAKLLALLLERGGEVVTRSEIQARLWGGDTNVDFEQGINYAVRHLRKALGDSASEPGYIETIPRTGYRMLMPVQRVNGVRRRKLRVPWRAAAALAVGVGIGSAATPCDRSKSIRMFHEFFGIDPEKCPVHRLLS